MDKVVTQLAETLISGEMPFTFECKIKFKDTNETENVTMCYCSENDYEDIANNAAVDEMIFFYIIDAENVLRNTLNNNDFEIVEVYEDTIIEV